MLKINFLTDWLKNSFNLQSEAPPVEPAAVPEPEAVADIKTLFWKAIQLSDAAAVQKYLDGSPELINAVNDDKQYIEFSRFYETGPVAFDDRVDQRNYEDGDDHRGFTPLAAACLKGDKVLFDLFTARGADIDCADSFGFTPVMCALLSQNADIIKSLADMGAALNVFSADGTSFCRGRVSPLTLAIKLCEADVIQYLLDKNADPDLNGGENDNPLSEAFNRRRPEAAELLIKAGALVEKAFRYDCGYIRADEAAFYLETALRVYGAGSGQARFFEDIYLKSNGGSEKHLLYEAARSDYFEIIKLLISRGADIEEDISHADVVCFYPEGVKITPFIAAAAGGCYETAKLLMERGANIFESQNAALRSALEGITIYRGYYRMSYCYVRSFLENKDRLLRMIISAGAKFGPGKYYIHEEPLGHVLYHAPDDAETIELVLNNVADKDFKQSILNDNFIDSILKSKNPDVIKMLLTHGADINTLDDKGNTGLIIAARKKKNISIIDVLIENGADVNIAGSGGDSALTLAAASYGVGTISRLLERGADIDHAAADGRTALMAAIAFYNEPAALYLIEKGCDTQNADKKGKTALSLAEAKKMGRVAELIKGRR
jgi:hypothetical protein